VSDFYDEFIRAQEDTLAEGLLDDDQFLVFFTWYIRFISQLPSFHA